MINTTVRVYVRRIFHSLGFMIHHNTGSKLYNSAEKDIDSKWGVQ